MKKKLLIAGLLICLTCGCEKTIPTLSNGDEAVVTLKDDVKISAKELYEKLKQSYATNTLIEMIDTKILEDKYSKKIEDADSYAESYIESIKKYYTDESGKYDEASLLSTISTYYGYSSLEQFQSAIRIDYLRNLAIEDYAESKISDSEIKSYYKSDIVGDREIKHIQIIPKTKDDMSDEEVEKAEEEALQKAKTIITKLKKGEKFDDLAKENSDASDKGSLGKINKGDYGSDEFDKEAWSLKVGEYSNAPVKTSSGYEIVYVVSEDEKAKLDDVKKDIIKTLAKKKISDDQTVQVSAIKELRKEYKLEIIDDEVKSNYNKYMDKLYDNALISNNNK